MQIRVFANQCRNWLFCILIRCNPPDYIHSDYFWKKNIFLMKLKNLCKKYLHFVIHKIKASFVGWSTTVSGRQCVIVPSHDAQSIVFACEMWSDAVFVVLKIPPLPKKKIRTYQHRFLRLVNDLDFSNSTSLCRDGNWCDSECISKLTINLHIQNISSTTFSLFIDSFRASFSFNLFTLHQCSDVEMLEFFECFAEYSYFKKIFF
jgi:hypothetical protein